MTAEELALKVSLLEMDIQGLSQRVARNHVEISERVAHVEKTRPTDEAISLNQSILGTLRDESLVLAERDTCAKLAEAQKREDSNGSWRQGYNDACRDIAQKIRERSG